jgi:Major Facilitator Superfamily
MTTPDRGLRLRSRLGTRCFLGQHGDVDHHTRVLSVAGATLAPSTLSLIRNMFLDPDQHAFAIGVWATSFAAGAAIGPLAGGVLEFFWWGSMFLLAVPVMALLLVFWDRCYCPSAAIPGRAGPDQRSDVIKSLIGMIGSFGA